MRFFLYAMLLVTVAGLYPVPAAAQKQGSPSLVSGAYLLNLCRRDKDGKEIAKGAHTACQSYIAGIVDYHKLLQSLGTAPGIDICVPNTAKLSRLQDIVWRHLELNSHHDSFNAAPAVVLALYEFYPCKGK
jgi:hypothetical protein